MGNGGQSVRQGLLVVLSLLFVLGTATPSSATGNIVKSDLKGTWQITLRGRTACGYASMLARLTFNTTGVGTGPLTTHGDCGDSTVDQTFTVTSLKANGAGKATLTCGTACAGGLWHFDIQVAPDRTKLNLADVTITDTDSFLEGVGIVSSVADNIVVADLKGEWYVSLVGHQFRTCGADPFTRVSAAGTLTLDDAGTGDLPATVKTNCGSFEDPVNPFTVLTLNADGSGTARMVCAADCDITFSFQVSPDRSMMNLVSVSPTDTLDMYAGVAIRRSTGGHIVPANLSGPWQGTVFVEELDGDAGASLVTFKLNAKGSSTKVTVVNHSTEGDGGGTCTATATLNADGSGTLSFSCGSDPTETFPLQVSPDRSTMGIAGVSPESEDLLTGVLIHQ
jgi:hypothetical protein